MKTQPKPLTPEELQALGYWKYSQGRYWKRELSHAWMTGQYPPSLPGSHPALLQGLRNRLGPTWLAGFKFGTPTEDLTH